MANLNWGHVRVDFNDANQAMNTSSNSLSRAGTVFGELRKSILDEEQRAVDNAYREKQFEENVRQFGLGHALKEDELTERARHNLASEDYSNRALDEQIRAHNLHHAAAMASVAAHRENNDIMSSLRALQFDKAARENTLNRVRQDISMFAGMPIEEQKAMSATYAQLAKDNPNDPMFRYIANQMDAYAKSPSMSDSSRYDWVNSTMMGLGDPKAADLAAASEQSRRDAVTKQEEEKAKFANSVAEKWSAKTDSGTSPYQLAGLRNTAAKVHSVAEDVILNGRDKKLQNLGVTVDPSVFYDEGYARLGETKHWTPFSAGDKSMGSGIKSAGTARDVDIMSASDDVAEVFTDLNTLRKAVRTSTGKPLPNDVLIKIREELLNARGLKDSNKIEFTEPGQNPVTSSKQDKPKHDRPSLKSSH